MILGEVKQELRKIFAKRKDLIIRLGNEFQKLVSDQESICEEIKNVLYEEIVKGVISTRDIERYCPDEWKKKTKPRSKAKNDNLSFSEKQESQQTIPQLLVGINGSSTINNEECPYVGHPTANTHSNNDIVRCEGSANEKEETICSDLCSVRKELEEVIRNSTQFTKADQQFSSSYEQGIVIELETKIKGLESDVELKSKENSDLRIRIEELQSKPESVVPNDHQKLTDRFFDVQFQISLEDLNRYMSSSFSKNNEVSEILFAATVDVVNRKLVDIQIG